MSAVKETTTGVTAYAPVITFISGCGESDGGVTDQKAATPSDCILTSAGVTPADISVFAETKKNYISGRKSGHLQLCLSAK